MHTDMPAIAGVSYISPAGVGGVYDAGLSGVPESRIS